MLSTWSLTKFLMADADDHDYRNTSALELTTRRLTSCDVNHALGLFDTQPIYGHEAMAVGA